MISVLFVCLGNICRSPMAEAIFRHKVKDAGLEAEIQIDSAGTGNWHVGNQPHVGTQKVLKENRISFEGIRARQVNESDFAEFDYIIAMDEKNVSDLESIKKGNPTAYVGQLLSFLPDVSDKNVPDPYFTGNFQVVYELIDESCSRLLTFIRERNNI
ncbi:low molecular weight protein-tyrosine-phosphatase [Bacillus solimangrovi]|uniref:protein-tyrosine-phosphatase n=1 Tax=Bacillus solimangrovi TaxID=1305675 RepID=A0A1E5LB68_9BACI|nr:low molecular weight protein-tyrosine-phosphatase [Bacillus solimangrovi]OEH91326.1 phosphotyrosine protein phosphatase [Bacillus solimangrovi]